MTDRIRFDLETELRVGIEHFVAGQHRAFTAADEPGTALLRYVDAMGWVVVMPCEADDGGVWRSCGIALRMSATGLSTGWRVVKPGFELSDRMRAALGSPEVMEVPDRQGLLDEAKRGRVVLEGDDGT